MQIFTSISDYKKRSKERAFYSKVGFAVSGGVYHLGLELALKQMSAECDCRVLLITPDFSDSDWAICDNFEKKIKSFNLDYLVMLAPTDNDLFKPRSFALESNQEWVDNSKAFFYLQIANIFKFDKFYIGQKDFFEAKILSDLIHDFNLDFELEVISNVREESGVLCSSNFTKYGNNADIEYQALNKTIDFTLRMIQNGQKDVLMLEKLINEYVASFKQFKLQKIIFLDAINLTEIGFIDGTRKIFFQLEGRINGKKYIDNIII